MLFINITTENSAHGNILISSWLFRLLISILVIPLSSHFINSLRTNICTPTTHKPSVLAFLSIAVLHEAQSRFLNSHLSHYSILPRKSQQSSLSSFRLSALTFRNIFFFAASEKRKNVFSTQGVDFKEASMYPEIHRCLTLNNYFTNSRSTVGIQEHDIPEHPSHLLSHFLFFF